MILGIDVGQGTTDILLWDPSDSFENAIQLIIPSASKRLAQKVQTLEGDIYCHGTVMGGIPLVKALKEKIKSGSTVYMTTEAALSIRYHLSFVRDLGIKILKPDDPVPVNTTSITTGDFRFKWLLDLFRDILGYVPHIEGVGLAVQDHGLHKETELAREMRLQFYKEKLTQFDKLSHLGFRTSVPNRFPRLQAALKEKERWFPQSKHYIIDTSPIAILGALQDKEVKAKMQGQPKTVINFGNGHTLVCVLDEDNKVSALFEHHTNRINQITKFDGYLEKFFDGVLGSQTVIDDLGHGSYYLRSIPSEARKNLIAIGPRRSIGKQSQFPIMFSNPGGSMMMAGPIALIKSLTG
ncbi:MAG: DUF1786 family protein [Candidatus Hodarchaeales archaeon]|jgi:uncharacterized protein (DUF1786 family)